MIAGRLREVMQKVRPEVAIPIIVEVTAAPQEAVGTLQGLGMSIKYVSKILPLVYGSATSGAIQTISQQGFVREISYDEPVYAL